MTRFAISRRTVLKLATTIAIGGLSTGMVAAQAADYPDKPITMIVPFAPGGPADIMGRTVAKALSESLDVSVAVVNRAGAGGNVGTNVVAHADPDGYTIGVSLISSLAIAPSLLKSLPYDVEEDIAPISMVGIATPAILAHPTAPFDTFEEFIEYVKENPGSIKYSTPGIGTAPHLASEWLSSLADIDIKHIPYKGTAPASQDLLAGVIPVGFESSLVTAARSVDAGKLKALAVMTKDRSNLLPDTPAISELGYPEFDAANWFCLVAPGGTPDEIIQKLNEVVVSAMEDSKIIDNFSEIGVVAQGSSPEDLKEYIREETEHWKGIIEDNDITVQ